MTITLAEVNRNPGNVKNNPTDPWKGSIDTDSHGHAIFADVEDGCRAAIRNMVAKYNSLKESGRNGNITEIISDEKMGMRPGLLRWAPTSDGNVPSEYIKAVCAWTGFNDVQDLRLATKAGIILNYHYFLMLMHAIEHFEAGKLWVPESKWLMGMAEYYEDYVETKPVPLAVLQ